MKQVNLYFVVENKIKYISGSTVYFDGILTKASYKTKLLPNVHWT